MSFQMILYK